MFPDQHADTVSTGITSPGTQKDQPYKKCSVTDHPGLINVGQHDTHIDHTEKGCHHLFCMIFRIRKHIDKHHDDQHNDRSSSHTPDIRDSAEYNVRSRPDIPPLPAGFHPVSVPSLHGTVQNHTDQRYDGQCSVQNPPPQADCQKCHCHQNDTADKSCHKHILFSFHTAISAFSSIIFLNGL